MFFGAERRLSDKDGLEILGSIDNRKSAIQTVESRGLNARGAFFILHSRLTNRLRPGVVKLQLVALGEVVGERGLERIVMVVSERRHDSGSLRPAAQGAAGRAGADGFVGAVIIEGKAGVAS